MAPLVRLNEASYAEMVISMSCVQAQPVCGREIILGYDSDCAWRNGGVQLTVVAAAAASTAGSWGLVIHFWEI
jgi:hypothetical protein